MNVASSKQAAHLVALLAVPKVAPGVRKNARFTLPWAEGCKEGEGGEFSGGT